MWNIKRICMPLRVKVFSSFALICRKDEMLMKYKNKKWPSEFHSLMNIKLDMRNHLNCHWYTVKKKLLQASNNEWMVNCAIHISICMRNTRKNRDWMKKLILLAFMSHKNSHKYSRFSYWHRMEFLGKSIAFNWTFTSKLGFLGLCDSCTAIVWLFHKVLYFYLASSMQFFSTHG